MFSSANSWYFVNYGDELVIFTHHPINFSSLIFHVTVETQSYYVLYTNIVPTTRKVQRSRKNKGIIFTFFPLDKKIYIIVDKVSKSASNNCSIVPHCIRYINSTQSLSPPPLLPPLPPPSTNDH